MAVDTDIDVDLLKSEIRKTYSSVSAEPDRDFIFPTGAPGRRISTTRPSSRGCPTRPSRPSRESPTRSRWGASTRANASRARWIVAAYGGNRPHRIYLPALMRA
jgi:hypothetical protein